MTEPVEHESVPKLGKTTLICLVIANMIGAGVFTSSGFSLAALGSPGRVMLAWGLCGAWAICGAVAYGALAARLPLSGGEYLYLSRLVHPSVGFLAGWISLLAGFTAPIAAAAYGAAAYSLPPTADAQTKTIVAAVVIVVGAVCHLLGLIVGTAVQNLIVLLKFLLLIAFIVVALGLSDPQAWVGMSTVRELAEQGQLPSVWPTSWGDWTELVGSMSWIALSYTGFNAAIYVAGQSKDPRRSVPAAMLIGTLVVTILYLALNYIFVYAPAPDAIAGKESVAAIAAQAVGGQPLELLMRVTIALSMSSSVFAMLLAGPRVYHKMAEDGVMPRLFLAGGRVPASAIVAQASLSLIAVFAASLLALMKYLGLTLSACGALAILSLCWGNAKLPQSRPVAQWQWAAVTVYLGITACILAASYNTHREEFVAMLLTFATGAVVYAVWRRLFPQD